MTNTKKLKVIDHIESRIARNVMERVLEFIAALSNKGDEK